MLINSVFDTDLTVTFYLPNIKINIEKETIHFMITPNEVVHFLRHSSSVRETKVITFNPKDNGDIIIM